MSQSPITRWWIAPPGPGETLRSVLDRAAQLYECDPRQLWRSLHADETPAMEHVDDPGTRALYRLAGALGVTPCRLQPLCVPDTPWRLAPAARLSYCPRCEALALAADTPSMALGAWTHVLRTQCPEHGVPLRLRPEAQFRGGRSSDAPAAPTDGVGRRVLDLIEAFATALEDSLYFGAPWPVGWRIDAGRARAALLSVSFHPGPTRGLPVIADVRPPRELLADVHVTCHHMDPVPAPTWDQFRAIADPAVRRAALWVVAWHVVPDLDEALCPGWLHLELGDEE
jgi:hypothetical protein